MSNGDAQTAVRQDILEADARSLESTVRAQIASPWTAFHFNGAAVPKIHFKVEPTEDQANLATVVNTLSQAGFKADPAELSERFGLKLRYEAPPAGGFAMTAETVKKKDDLTDALEEWLGPLSKELSAISGDDGLSDDEFGKRLAACAEGKKNGSSEKFERFLEGQIYEGFASGVTK
ncbi:MAG: DUF935 family protein [Lentisphaeria bacterium]|nr:DUF935 family protein [Lentisphaeria bacterium]